MSLLDIAAVADRTRLTRLGKPSFRFFFFFDSAFPNSPSAPGSSDVGPFSWVFPSATGW